MSPTSSRLVRSSSTSFRQRLSNAWAKLRSISPLYLAIGIMAAYAVLESQTPVTMIAPFQLPKADMPFSGDIVADALQDGLTSIRTEIEAERADSGLQSSDTGLPDLRNMLIPKFRRVQAPPRFSVEIQGVSYQRVLSFARALMRTEITVSGDVMVKGKEFTLIARAGDSGPWESVSVPISADGLKRASRDLAEKILGAQDPTLAGVALLKDGQVDQALKMLGRARAQSPKDVRLKLNLCMGFGANRRYDEAINCYEEAHRVEPNSPEALEGLAQVHYLKGEREVAIKLYDDLAHKHGYMIALLGLGEALDDNGQHEDALKTYNEFLAAEQLDRDRAIAHLKRSAALAHLGRHGDALAEYEEALKYAPRDALILVHKGLELARGGDLDAGIAQLRSVVNENKNSDSAPFALLQLGLLLQQKGDWQGASAQFRAAAELRPNYVEAHLKLATVLAQAGRKSEALAEYDRVAKLSPSDVERGSSQILANQWLGNVLRDQADYAGAASAYREAIRLSSGYGAAHSELGYVLERQGQLSGAIHEYRAALLAPKAAEVNGSEWLAVAHRRLGAALVSEGPAHWAEGIAELRKAMELNPSHVESYLFLGKVLYNHGHLVEASSVYKEATKIEPKSAAAHNGLGLILEKEGLSDEASSEFTTAVNLEPNNARYRANLAHELEFLHPHGNAAAERRTMAKFKRAHLIRP